jgi:hypothetical protein
VAGVLHVADAYVGGGGFFNDEGGVVVNELVSGYAGEGEPGAVLVGGVIPVKYPPVLFKARAPVALVVVEVEPVLVDLAVGVEGSKLRLKNISAAMPSTWRP